MKFLGLLCVLILPLQASAQSAVDSESQKALRDLELEINPIKEQVYATKARAHDLQEAVLRGKITGSKALIVFINEAEGFFAFKSAEFLLDGRLVKKIVLEPKKEVPKSVNIFDGDIPSGEHSIKVRATYTGSDKSLYRSLSYLKDHAFTLEVTEKFDVEYGKTTQVNLAALDRGYFKSNINERLFMEVKILRDWGTDSTD